MRRFWALLQDSAEHVHRFLVGHKNYTVMVAILKSNLKPITKISRDNIDYPLEWGRLYHDCSSICIAKIKVLKLAHDLYRLKTTCMLHLT